jgi:hypothetical protein
MNIQNPITLFEGTPFNHHKQLISLLFLVGYDPILGYQLSLAVRCFTVITAKGDLLYAPAMTAIVPSLSGHGLSAIGRVLVAP